MQHPIIYSQIVMCLKWLKHTSKGWILLLQCGGIVNIVIPFSLVISRASIARWLSWLSKIKSSGFSFDACVCLMKCRMTSAKSLPFIHPDDVASPRVPGGASLRTCSSKCSLGNTITALITQYVVTSVPFFPLVILFNCFIPFGAKTFCLHCKCTISSKLNRRVPSL